MPRSRLRTIAILAAAFAGVGLWCAIWAFAFEPDRLIVRHVAVASEQWPQDQPPLRIVAIADLHAGAPFIDREKIARVVAAANAAGPDLILLLGDYMIQQVIGGHPMTPEAIADALAPLSAPCGVWAVLGNHDWLGDGPRVQRALEARGVRVLENDAAPLPATSPTVWLAGIADDSTRTPDVARAFAGAPPDAAVIVIAHDPAVFGDIPARAALTLAGHTHGGQIALPLVGAIYVPGRSPLRWSYGPVVEDGKRLWVSSGVGTSVIGARFLRPPEIVVLTLGPARP